MYKTLQALNKELPKCKLCPRLVTCREDAPEDYWRKPTFGFGDPKAKLFILGLAPSAKGGNRTGRIFTGDASALFLFKCLHKAGLANQPTSESLDDDLELNGCYITSIVKCLPPKHRPNALEKKTCARYWQNELELLPQVQTILALGQMAFETALHLFNKKATFAHGAKVTLNEKFASCRLLPSQPAKHLHGQTHRRDAGSASQNSSLVKL